MHHKFELSSIFRTLLAFPRVPHYTYKPLSDPTTTDRLLLLHPAPFHTSPLQCQLLESTTTPRQTQNASQAISKYTALSYTWGTITQNTRISLDGRRFHITPNLDLALRHLRHPRREVRVWADSLCINQTDVEERNQHVARMRDIYSAADKTTIFLGAATEGSDMLLNAMLSVGQSSSRSAVVKALVRASQAREEELRNEVFRILRRPYWSRIWIFQEIVVSSNPWVQCGGMAVSWEVFCQCVVALLGEENEKGSVFGSGYSNEPRRRLQDIYWERRAYRAERGQVEPLPMWDMGDERDHDHGASEGRMKLLDLLVTKRGSQATDARDMVFAVSGVASTPTTHRKFGITYEKSPVLVYMDVVRYLLATSTNPYEVLSHAGLQSQSRSQPQSSFNGINIDGSKLAQKPLPSWIPDWRVPNPYKSGTLIADWLKPTPPSKAQQSLFAPAPNFTILSEHSILAIPGCVHGSITSFPAPPPAGPDSIGRVIWHSSPKKRPESQNPHSHSHKPIQVRNKPPLPNIPTLLSTSHPLTYRRKLATLDSAPSSDSLLLDGTQCLVPSDAEVGDIIAFFSSSNSNSRIAFVLRPLPDSSLQAKMAMISARSSFGQWLGRWVFGQKKMDEERRELDMEISTALKARAEKVEMGARGDEVDEKSEIGGHEVGHFILVGEALVDEGPKMNLGSEDSETRNKRSREARSEVVFALH